MYYKKSIFIIQYFLIFEFNEKDIISLYSIFLNLMRINNNILL